MSQDPKIHNKGPKADRDRQRCLDGYAQLTRFFWWKNREPASKLAKMSNQQLYQLQLDFFNALPIRQRNRYAEHCGLMRRNPLAFRWFLSDLLKYSKYTKQPAWILVLTSPFRYPGYLARSKKAKAVAPEQQGA